MEEKEVIYLNIDLSGRGNSPGHLYWGTESESLDAIVEDTPCGATSLPLFLFSVKIYGFRSSNAG